MKFRRDKIDVILLIVMAISAGILLLLAALGYLNGWHLLNYLVLVSGVVLVLDVLVRHAMPEYHRPEETIPTLLIGLMVICIGASNLYGLVKWLSTLIIVVLAVLIIAYRLRQWRRKPT
jgi:prepilin signal peptidase PulO-like enzyme (type II secretory pathway)